MITRDDIWDFPNRHFGWFLLLAILLGLFIVAVPMGIAIALLPGGRPAGAIRCDREFAAFMTTKDPAEVERLGWILYFDDCDVERRLRYWK